jgi:predicted kinase
VNKKPDHQVLYIFRGPSGAGKSTLAMSLQLHDRNIKVVEADMFFINEKNEYIFDAERLGEAHKWCYDQAKEYLDKGHSVVVANVNYQLKHFQLYLSLAERLEIPVFVVLVEGNFRESDDSLNKAPSDVVARQKRLWEPYAW